MQHWAQKGTLKKGILYSFGHLASDVGARLSRASDGDVWGMAVGPCGGSSK